MSDLAPSHADQIGPPLRHIALLFLRPGADPGAIPAVEAALRELAPPGMRSLTVSQDLSLAPGSADWVIVADFDDEAAYLGFSTDEGHLRIRQELLRPVLERAERSQIHLLETRAD